MFCEKKCRHESVFGDNVLYVQAKTATHEDREIDNQGQESSADNYSGHCSDSSLSYFLNYLSPVACEASDASGKEEEEILAAQSECNGDLHDVQDLQVDEACCYIRRIDSDVFRQKLCFR